MYNNIFSELLNIKNLNTKNSTFMISNLNSGSNVEIYMKDENNNLIEFNQINTYRFIKEVMKYLNITKGGLK